MSNREIINGQTTHFAEFSKTVNQKLKDGYALVSINASNENIGFTPDGKCCYSIVHKN